MEYLDRLLGGGPARTNWVRLRTLIYLRWLAVAGQATAVLVAAWHLDIALPLDRCLLLIGLSAAFNVGASLVQPANARLNQRAALLTLLYDLAQLTALLYLTGGISNPFATLILAQTIISATVLTLGATLILGALSLAAVAFLSVFHLPLTLADGQALQVPPLLLVGSWAALSLSIIFIGVYARLVSTETYSMSEALTATQLALEREQKLTALGGMVAAAAHELGTPLATIMLVSTELADELEDRPELAEDVALIRAQAVRCRDILAAMGRSGKDDLHVRHAPFSALVEEAAEPHVERGKRVILRVRGEPGPPPAAQPVLARRSEVLHGVRNLVQNAVDFARATVWIDLDWSDEQLILRVGDDGRGYPPDLLGRIGDPFLRRRGGRGPSDAERPGYAGMGLGLFIAKTLLERTGARLTFTNGTGTGTGADAPPDAGGAAADRARPSGAIVEVVWPRGALEVAPDAARGALGNNLPVQMPS
ncbi:ActS/PrrB/RegB family redox-sensitive histidine kinase [Rhodobacteraceae bacterium 2CG4]|uniref:histidine kinase n=1 Tax=Halovulum marinum TaxID=2662447 RepID=A0A6L5YYS4_9RHOB|nr:ActS/PrrB/RegB family redox-sensitive histidine kinase [Halovulum marinum]MSU89437.1 ActS/PrrB/RegB family redox-sensitive histidine kinase [Halovulum marinum]